MVELSRNGRNAEREELRGVAEVPHVGQDLPGDVRVHRPPWRAQPRVHEDAVQRHAILRIALQEAPDEVLGVTRDGLPCGIGHRVRFALHPLQLLREVAPEGRLAAEHDIGHYAEGPQIAGRAVAVALARLEHLRGGVREAAHGGAHPRLAEVEPQAPVDDLDGIILRVGGAEADVLGLHVAVRDPAVVRVLQRAGGLAHDVCRRLLIDVPVVHDAVENLPPLAVLHDEEHESALLVGLEELADVWVVELLHDLHLFLKGLLLLFVEDGDLLDRNHAILHFAVARDEHLAVAAGADLVRVDFVALGDLHADTLRHEGLDVEAALPTEPGVARPGIEHLRAAYPFAARRAARHRRHG
mmetsp:Transcript_36449/g.104998  ORF Transcript_36449/g.104998 Transcript_36449/m.104998 type:complete len:356 (-) Transcript_36449:152-1219(-)